jgi:hypothetical protein
MVNMFNLMKKKSFSISRGYPIVAGRMEACCVQQGVAIECKLNIYIFLVKTFLACLSMGWRVVLDMLCVTTKHQNISSLSINGLTCCARHALCDHKTPEHFQKE